MTFDHCIVEGRTTRRLGDPPYFNDGSQQRPIHK